MAVEDAFRLAESRFHAFSALLESERKSDDKDADGKMLSLLEKVYLFKFMKNNKNSFSVTIFYL